MQLENVPTVSNTKKTILVTNGFRQDIHRLLDSKHFLLPLLGSKFPLDAAIGTNGRVWIKSKELKHVIAAVRCIEQVDPEGENLVVVVHS